MTAEKIKSDFLRLVQLLTLKGEAHQLMMELAVRTSVEDSETNGISEKGHRVKAGDGGIQPTARSMGRADSDERSRLAASLFQDLVIDLDKEHLVDFRLHAWADQYLCLRAELYEDGDSGPFGGSGDNGSSEGNKNRFTAVESDEAIHDPNGRRGARQYMKSC